MSKKKACVAAVAGRKGGCAKTSVSMLMGGEALDLGFKVSIIDANPLEASLSESVRGGEGLILRQIVHEAEDVSDLESLVADYSRLVDLVIIDTPPASDELSKISMVAMGLADVIILPMGNDLDEMRSQSEFYDSVVSEFMKLGKKCFIQPNRVEPESKIWRRVCDEMSKPNVFQGAEVLDYMSMCVTFKEVKALGMALLEFPSRSRAIKRLSDQSSVSLKRILDSVNGVE